MKEKAAKKQSFLNRKRAEWKEMKLWNGNELCKVDWIVSILILTVLFFTCVHSDVKLTGNRSFLMYKHFSDFYQVMSSPAATGQIICRVRLSPMQSGTCRFI